MRHKIIKAFLAIYLAVCTLYGATRAIYYLAVTSNVESTDTVLAAATQDAYVSTKWGDEDAASGDTTVQAEVTTAPAEEDETTAAASTPEPTASPETQQSEATAVPETTAETAETTAAPETTAETTESAAAATETAAPTATPSYEETTDTADTAEEVQAAPAAAVPSLEDYLSSLHCGGCGRNCLLINPRCMNGARKEEQATTEYYDTYGDAASDGT